MLKVPTFLAGHLTSFRKFWATDSVHGRFARGAVWSFAGVMISRLLTLASSIVVARFLGKSVFGELGIVQGTIGMFQVFAGFALGTTATKYVAELSKKSPDRAGSVIVFSSAVSWITGALAGTSLLVAAPWLASHTLAAAHLSPILRISSLMLLAGAATSAQNGALAGLERFDLIARVNLLTGVISFPMLLAGVYFDGLRGAVVGLTANLAANWIIGHFAVRRAAKAEGICLSFGYLEENWAAFRRFTIPAVLSGVIVSPVNWACSAILARSRNGYSEMGVFNAASQWFSALLFLPGILATVLLPLLSERLSNDDTERSRKLLITSIQVDALVVGTIVVLGALASPMIMNSYGDGFVGTWPTLVVMLLTAGILALSFPVAQMISASGRMWIALAMNIGWGVMNIGAALLLVNRGAFGIATARLIAYIFHAVWTFAFAYVHLRRKSLVRQARSTSDSRFLEEGADVVL